MLVLKNLIRRITNILPIQNTIIFESCPDFSDNTKPVFDEMLKRGYSEKYKMVWMCHDPIYRSNTETENVKYLDVEKHRIQAFFYNHTSKVTICCNRWLGTVRKGQTSFYLSHGTPYKDVSSYYNAPASIDYVVASSRFFKPILANQLKISEEKCIPLGFPRNDILFQPKKDLSAFFGRFSKYIVWYPTVKHFLGGEKTGSIQPIQFIWDKDMAERINECARKADVLIIVKPHFAQISEDIKKFKLSNIIFIDDSFFGGNDITSYEFIGSCDALLTDYSSVYYDFLLCNRPVGLIWEDIEEYKRNPGLIKEYETVSTGGVKIYKFEDLLAFVVDVSHDIDTLGEKRKKILPLIQYSDRPDNTCRVVDFIVKTCNLKV